LSGDDRRASSGVVDSDRCCVCVRGGGVRKVGFGVGDESIVQARLRDVYSSTGSSGGKDGSNQIVIVTATSPVRHQPAPVH